MSNDISTTIEVNTGGTTVATYIQLSHTEPLRLSSVARMEFLKVLPTTQC